MAERMEATRRAWRSMFEPKLLTVLREGYGSDDIAAGLAYSVGRNCLYKVLKLKDTSSLDDNGDYRLLSAEHVFNDYLYSTDNRIALPD